MSTILFHEIAFGPLHSRRLGVSLGVNLLPYDGKLCSFDCIYCECGFNKDNKTHTKLPTRENVRLAIEAKLRSLNEGNESIDVITFAGNGEPTIHPQFAEIIDDTIQLRSRYVPHAEISVLSNAMHIGNAKIFNALQKVDKNILKLDSACIETVRLLDKPNSTAYSIDGQVALFKQFEGNFILQTMFLKGSHKGMSIDNTTENEIVAWLRVVEDTKPKEVMIYTIDRETPEKNLEKIPLSVLQQIAHRVHKLGLGIAINIAGS